MDTTRHEVLAKFRDLPVIDTHVHHSQPYSIPESLEFFKDIKQRRNYEAFAFMPYHLSGSKGRHPNASLESLYYKKQFPGSWAFCGLQHYCDERDTAEGYLEQVKHYRALGCDGVKMLEGKPDLHRTVGRGIDDPVYDKFYAYMEENGLPITMHICDPADNWDPDKVSDYAKKVGWFYGDPSYPARERIYIEVWNLMRKFPALKLNLAHFGFFGYIPQMAEEFLSAWKNTRLDLTPGGIMFAGFSANPEYWKDFFVRHQDRIVFGSDCYNMPEDTVNKGGPLGRWELVRSCLEFTEPFKWPTMEKELIPFGFDDTMLKKLYHDNAVAFFGGAPKELDEARIDWSPLGL